MCVLALAHVVTCVRGVRIEACTISMLSALRLIDAQCRAMRLMCVWTRGRFHRPLELHVHAQSVAKRLHGPQACIARYTLESILVAKPVRSGFPLL